MKVGTVCSQSMGDGVFTAKKGEQTVICCIHEVMTFGGECAMDLWASLVSLTDHWQFSVPLMTLFVRQSYLFSSSHLSDPLESESSKSSWKPTTSTSCRGCIFVRNVINRTLIIHLVQQHPQKNRKPKTTGAVSLKIITTSYI